MRSRFQLHSGPPAEAEHYKTLAWVKAPFPNGRMTVKLWRGKALKPLAYNIWVNEENADDFIEKSKRAEDDRIERAAKRRLDRAADTQQRAKEIEVGTILHYSWGYDQTQSEYFEVVERRGLSVVIREIGSASVPGSDHGGMSDQNCPCPGNYVGPPMRKRITGCGISMDFGCATVVHPWEKHYRSWYA